MKYRCILLVLNLLGSGWLQQPLFNCQSLQEVCIGQEISVQCTVPGNSIGWLVNSQCQINFGYIQQVNDLHNSSSPCFMKNIQAKLIYKAIDQMVTSQLQFKLNPVHKSNAINVTCLQPHSDSFNKNCQVQLKKIPIAPRNVAVTICKEPLLTWISDNSRVDYYKVLLSSSGRIVQTLEIIGSTSVILMGLKPGEYNAIVIAVNCNGESKPSKSIKILIEDDKDDKTPAPSPPPSVVINCSAINKSAVLVVIVLALFIVILN